MRFFVVIILLFSFSAFSNVCLSPIEQAALLGRQGGGATANPSLKSEIKQARKAIAQLEKGLERIEDSLEEVSDELANSLNSSKTLMFPSSVVDKISEYIEGRHDKWEDIDTDDCVSAASRNKSSDSRSDVSQSSTNVFLSPIQENTSLKTESPINQQVPSENSAVDADKATSDQEDAGEIIIYMEDDDLGFRQFFGKRNLASYVETGFDLLLPSAYAEGDELEMCVPWKNKDSKKYFSRKGKIKKGFCKEFSSSRKKCEKYLEKLRKKYDQKIALEKKIEDLSDLISSLEEEDFDRKYGFSDEEETEAGGLCFDCLERVRDLNKPTTGQIVGNVLSLAGGVALSAFGLREARKAQRSANDLRVWQGHEAQNNFGYSLSGLGMGFPFIAKGLYGLTNGNRARGSFACGGGVPYGAGYPNAGFRAGFGGGYPGAYGGGFPNAGFQAGLGGGYPGGAASFLNPLAALGLGAGLQAGLGGGFPYGGGGLQASLGFGSPYGGGYPGAGLQAGLGGGFPYGAGFPGGGLQASLGFGSPYGGGYPGGGLQAGLGGGFPYGGAGLQAGLGFGSPYGGGYPGGGLQAGLGGGFGSPYGGGAYGAGVNPYLLQQQQAQAAQAAQQQYAAQLAQQQYQAQLKAQQAWIQQQQAIQQQQQRKQKVISGLTQEIYKIQQQINLVATTGVGSSVLGASSASLNLGLATGAEIAGGGLNHNPAASTNTGPTSAGELPVINAR